MLKFIKKLFDKDKQNYPHYDECEIKKHCTKYDCWIIVNNKVYDITQFIQNHPGGTYCLLKNASLDCTEHLNFHDAFAKKLLETFFIGYVKK